MRTVLTKIPYIYNSIFHLVAILLILATPTSFAGSLNLPQSDASPELLPAEQAFTITHTVNGDSISIDWFIAPGCYLYKDRFAFKAVTPRGEMLLKANYQPAKKKYDYHFDKELDVFFETTNTLLSIKDLPRPLTLVITSQGCADGKLCYPPITREIDIPAS